MDPSLAERVHAALRRLPIERLRHPSPVVAVVRLAGPIGALGGWRGGLSLPRLATPLARAFRLPNLVAVALQINSPGGAAVQSSLIASRIRDLAAERKVPVFAFCEDVAASGGYWLACAGDEIWCDAGSILGSIGVVTSGFGLHALLERFGVRRRLYTSGDKKAMLDPFSPEKPEDEARLAAIQAEIHAEFIAWVKARRGAKLAADDATLFSGEFWTGRRALALGLADGIGELRATMRARFGEKVRLRLVTLERRGLLQRLMPGLAAPAAEDWAEAAIAAAEARALWARYGV
jgi:signal peptide peptidase SppA